MQNYKKTPIFPFHEAEGATIAPFAGWLMPIYYKSIIEEHRCVRNDVGLFDLCHMGEVWVKGKDAHDFIQKIITNDAKKLSEYKIIYTPICNDSGGILDDILVYCKDRESYMCVVNASNIQKDYKWFVSHAKGMDVEIVDASEETSLIGVQGPHAVSILRRVFGPHIHNIRYYQFMEQEFCSNPVIVSRTGYTGEDGFEIYLSSSLAMALWKDLLKIGAQAHMQPIGLGARDTLRLEMRYPLYGHDITEHMTPHEAGLGWTVAFTKGSFIGYDALVKKRNEGLTRKLVGFEMVGRGIPRQGCLIKIGTQTVGEVTSGSYSPSLNKNIGLGYIPVLSADPGSLIHIDIRDKEQLARVVKTPFYKGTVNK